MTEELTVNASAPVALPTQASLMLSIEELPTLRLVHKGSGKSAVGTWSFEQQALPAHVWVQSWSMLVASSKERETRMVLHSHGTVNMGRKRRAVRSGHCRSGAGSPKASITNVRGSSLSFMHI